MIKSVQFEKIGAAPMLSGFSLAASAVAGDQSLLFLFESSEGSTETGNALRAAGVLPHPKMGRLKRYRLLRLNGRSELWIDLPPLELHDPHVDLFPDGRVLLASAWCAWRADRDYDVNGIIFDSHTAQMNRLLLGDGISDLQIDSRGRIWVAYLDEGIFGNHGWGHPGPAPVGQAGLVCFSALGEKIWEFPNDAGHAIYDCYALNVSGAEAAIFFYSDFPVCWIGADFQLTWKRTKLLGCHAFAMSETEILFSSQYQESPETAHLGRLDRDGIVMSKRARLAMPDGSGRPSGRLQGRGRHLYHFGEDGVYRATVD